jgi:hypothetical protein
MVDQNVTNFQMNFFNFLDYDFTPCWLEFGIINRSLLDIFAVVVDKIIVLCVWSCGC